MDALLTVLGFSFLSPFLFIIGFHVGKRHIRRLAINGGEERYPQKVQEVVERYREERSHELESLEYVKE